MKQPNFQGWLIKLAYYDDSSGWGHFSCITRNGDTWFYLDPAFSIIDPTADLQGWGCDAFEKYDEDIQGPKRILRPGIDDTTFRKKLDCDRLKKYGLTAVNYMGSKYLG